MFKAIEDAIREAIRALAPPWDKVAIAHFGLNVRTKHGLMTRRAAAAQVLCRAEKWYRSPSDIMGGATPEQHVSTMVALALVAAEHSARAALERHDKQQAPPDDRPLPNLDKLSPLPQLIGVWQQLPAPKTHGLSTVDGLRGELARVLAQEMYRPFRVLHEHATFVSITPTLELRRSLNDPTGDDRVYVISRADESRRSVQDDHHGKEWARYVAYLTLKSRLTGHERRNRSSRDPSLGINQVRIVITSHDDTDALTHIHRDMVPLHKHGEIKSFPLALLGRYPLISALKFGCLVSTTQNYAMVTIPPKIPLHTLTGQSIPDFVSTLPDEKLATETSQAPDDAMRAIITADPDLIRSIIAEFDQLLGDSAATSL